MNLELNKYLPREDLRPYIRFYYTVSIKEGQMDLLLDNHPQGTVDLMLMLEGQVGFSAGINEESVLKKLILIGQQEQKFSFRFLPHIRLLGVTFTAEGFGKIFSFPVNELTNTGMVGVDLLHREDRYLLERVAEMRNDRARILLLNDIFARKIYELDIPFDGVDGAIQALRTSGGQLSIKELADAYNMSTRTLQRKFAAKIGVSPKTFARIARFNYMLRLLKQQPKTDWMDLLYRSGYYDQMHFIKEFKQFTGVTPSKYLDINHDLRDFFLGEE